MNRLFTSILMLTVLATCLELPSRSATAQESKTEKEAGKTQLWYGELDVKAAVLRLEFHVTKNEDGTFSGEMVSLDQGNARVALDSFAVEGNSVKFTCKQARFEFEGELDKSKEKVSGTFKQLGKEYPLELSLKDGETGKHTQTWAGRMKAGGREFDFQFRVFEADGAAPTVKMDSFTENDFGREGTVKIEGNEVTIEIPSTRAVLVGTLNEEKNRLDGKWKQAGGEFDIVLRDIDLSQTRDPKAKRPQMPKPPFKYKSESVEIENKADGVKLAATFTRPRRGGPYTTVILISGSGPQDRDETIFGHKPFFVIADHLAQNGIATLRYDERGVGSSTGEFGSATSVDFSRDVEAIVEHLKTNDKVDPKKIVLVGHSEGGLIAPMVAAKRDDIGGIISLAGPGVPGRDILFNQSRLMAAAEGASEVTLDAQEEMMKAVLDSKPEDRTKDFYLKVLNKMNDAMPEDEQDDGAKIEAAAEAMKGTFSSVWLEFFIDHDPRADLRKVKIPFLALVGEKDLQVDPKLNMPEIEKAIKEAGNENYQAKIFPGLNHLFQSCETGSPSEYPRIEQTFAPEVLDAMTAWLKENFE